VLAAAAQVRVSPADQSAALQLDHLAPAQQDLFGRARRVQALNGEPYVVARPGEERVFVVDETEELNLERAQQVPPLPPWGG
jgi:hypothetical protein